MLLRLIDDSLCVSAVERTRDGFLSAMGSGFPRYGGATSVAKTCVASSTAPPASTADTADSVTAAAGSLAAAGHNDPRALRAPAQGASATDGRARRYFRWCGLLLNMATCEVHPDMSRRRAHVSIGPRAHKPQLRARMRTAVKAQLRAVFVDPTLNSAVAVRRNVYHGLLHAVSAALAAVGRSAAAHPAGGLIGAVRELIGFAARVVRGNQLRCLGMARAGTPDSRGGGSAADTPRGSTLVDPSEVAWCAWTALLTALPASCVGMRGDARSRRTRLEVSGQLCAESLQLLRAAADARNLVVGGEAQARSI